MITRKVYLLLLGLILCSATGLTTQSDRIKARETDLSGGNAAVSDREMYYEIHGEGEPLILLYGGLGGIVKFSRLIPVLAETRQVIAVQLQGHGRTADIIRSLSYEQLRMTLPGSSSFSILKVPTSWDTRLAAESRCKQGYSILNGSTSSW